MTRVAIIGSCITRDLWPIRGEGSQSPCYISRTSLPSLFSRPAEGLRAETTPPSGLTKYQHQAVLADLQKRALDMLVAYRPTHIIFDFIDERFDLLTLAGRLYTHSWELETTGYLNQAAFAGVRAIPRVSQACASLWAAAAAEMTAFIRGTCLGEAKLILHEARWAEAYREGDGRIRPFDDNLVIWEGKPASIPAHNRLLAEYDRIFLELNPQAERVAAPDHRTADAGHRWGLSPFHYVDAYYEDITRQLGALGISLPSEAPQAPPSAPAA